eukprot:CAMPEP_0197175330 /NCGR_PEP_ID=MMETSP1423-20130617/1577_1 /TAXON_ID=476441 /ORGANISM="Pseudo-nitzschia heimii, Strain UNC1101" /LENGTH=421 /DNA_ID=CAMNT_0042624453 /DNA_START=179 /DNA_END=1444 /DNA_ORIENTATION=-
MTILPATVRVERNLTIFTKAMGIVLFLLVVCSSDGVRGFSIVGGGATVATSRRAAATTACPPIGTVWNRHCRKKIMQNMSPSTTTMRQRKLADRSAQQMIPCSWRMDPASGPGATRSATTTRLRSSSSSAETATTGVRGIIDWIQGEPLESLLSREETVAICRELTADRELLDKLEAAIVANWDRIVRKVTRSDTGGNTLGKLLGEEATQRLLRGVQNVDLYSDPKTVNAFLQSEAVNELFAQTLYDGIYEFFQTIDVFGNIISNLPVLGPIRNKIRDDLKTQLDRTLGPTLRSFLGGYTNVAIGRAAGFVLSEQNRRAFGAANARLLQSLLERPLEDLLPESSNPSVVKLRTEFFGYLRNLGDEDSTDLEDYASLAYDLIGDKSLDSLGLNVHRVLDASPTLESTANRILDEALERHRSS